MDKIIQTQSVERLRKRVRTLVETHGGNPTARALNVAPSVIARFVASLPQKEGSVLMIEKYINNAEALLK